MTLHDSTFEYLKPTEKQMASMSELRAEFKTFAITLDRILPDGPDKTHVMRTLRTAAMWANIVLTRNPDGAPRT